MERMLLWWDELDDLLGASRHVVRNAVSGSWSWLRRLN